jgi:hypothetical protein
MTPQPNPRAERLAEIRARESKATKGPWRACAWDPMERPHVHKDAPSDTHCGPRGDLPLTGEDAEFIAHAREDIPFLLAELDMLQQRLDGMFATADNYARNRNEALVQASRALLENAKLREALELISIFGGKCVWCGTPDGEKHACKISAALEQSKDGAK